MRWGVVCVVVSIATLWPVSVRAQLAIVEKLVTEVEHLQFGWTCWQHDAGSGIERGDCDLRRSVEIRVSYGVTRLPIPFLGGALPKRAEWRPTSISVSPSGDTTKTSAYQKVFDTDDRSYLAVELSLGYSQYSRLKNDQATTAEIRGYVREFPSVTVTSTVSVKEVRSDIFALEPYLGLSSGVVQLQAFRATVPDTTVGQLNSWQGQAQTFQLGAEAGARVRLYKLEAYVAYALHFRHFASVEWEPKGIVKTVPAGLPRELNFSGGSLLFGARFHLKE